MGEATGHSIAVRPGAPADLDAVLRVARALPEWFTPRGLDQMAIDLRFQPFLVAAGSGAEVEGFASFYVAEGIAWIGWLGVAPERQRSGVGRALCERLFLELGVAGVREVRVETLGDSVDYEPYARTRSFYASLGFVEHTRVRQDDTEWPDRLTLRRQIAPPAG
jgi:GNAT superfamily N-acetyltransferase